MGFLNQIREKLRFSLKALLGFTTVAAVFFWIGSRVGYIEAIGLVAAIVLFTCAKNAGSRKTWRPMARTFGIGILWMTAVDVSWFWEVCQDCRLDREALHCRVYGVSVLRIPLGEYSWIVCRIAEDLGKPCQHQFEREHLTRFWGMFLPARPGFFTGTLRLGDGPPEWYDEETSRILRMRAQASPELAEEFHARVIVSRDREYTREFVWGLIEERTGKPFPPEAP